MSHQSLQAIAIIPARGGSKRIPRKNIRPFLGKPILQYVIEAALASQCFDSVMVSTEDPKVKACALSCGAAVPFLRSEGTANDYADLNDVLEEVLLAYQGQGITCELTCLLLPTAPFITPVRLREGHEKLVTNKELDAVIPVTRLGPIQRALKIENEQLAMIWPEYMDSRSNDLVPAYQDCGQFYWLRTERFLETQEIYMPNAGYLLIPETETQDIDTEEDWQMAELKYQRIQSLPPTPLGL